ncbi:MAG: carboxypeptidase-like regulatory domain-containing protein [Marinoscillum sp.]
MKYLIVLTLLTCAGICFGQDKSAGTENSRQIIQFTGVIFTPDSSSVIPGVHVYVPAAGRGTTTNPYGFFSLPVQEGDSVVFSAVGFKRQFFIVPEHRKSSSLKMIFTMREDVTFLSEVEVFPYPTEEMFKAAVLALDDPNQRYYDNMDAWLGSGYMSTAAANLPSNPGDNYRYFLQQQAQANRNNYQAPANNYLNPFAWARFIKSLKEDK